MITTIILCGRIGLYFQECNQLALLSSEFFAPCAQFMFVSRSIVFGLSCEAGRLCSSMLCWRCALLCILLLHTKPITSFLALIPRYLWSHNSCLHHRNWSGSCAMQTATIYRLWSCVFRTSNRKRDLPFCLGCHRTSAQWETVVLKSRPVFIQPKRTLDCKRFFP